MKPLAQRIAESLGDRLVGDPEILIEVALAWEHGPERNIADYLTNHWREWHDGARSADSDDHWLYRALEPELSADAVRLALRTVAREIWLVLQEQPAFKKAKAAG